MDIDQRLEAFMLMERVVGLIQSWNLRRLQECETGTLIWLSTELIASARKRLEERGSNPSSLTPASLMAEAQRHPLWRAVRKETAWRANLAQWEPSEEDLEEFKKHYKNKGTRNRPLTEAQAKERKNLGEIYYDTNE